MRWGQLKRKLTQSNHLRLKLNMLCVVFEQMNSTGKNEEQKRRFMFLFFVFVKETMICCVKRWTCWRFPCSSISDELNRKKEGKKKKREYFCKRNYFCCFKRVAEDYACSFFLLRKKKKKKSWAVPELISVVDAICSENRGSITHWLSVLLWSLLLFISDYTDPSISFSLFCGFNKGQLSEF